VGGVLVLYEFFRRSAVPLAGADTAKRNQDNERSLTLWTGVVIPRLSFKGGDAKWPISSQTSSAFVLVDTRFGGEEVAMNGGGRSLLNTL
jgi:hypothetical protein